MTRALFIVRVVVAALLVCATAYAVHRWCWRPYRCAAAVSAGATALEAAEHRSDADRQRIARAVQTNLRRCACSSPELDMRTYFALAEASAAMGDYRAAIADYERALAIDRRPELYFALGMAYLNALDRLAALHNLARACAFDPARLAAIPYPEIREETARRVADR
jgi:tetratricopeptide (TPR) repeat protein